MEAFFAKQAPKTGIAPHSDGCNFILTAHLGLDVPEGKCWIKVRHNLDGNNLCTIWVYQKHRKVL